MKCYFCGKSITPGQHIEHHHPDKDHHPDWTEPAHRECHRRYHQEANHFKEWGAKGGLSAPYRGRKGYELAIAKWPGFHRMGGLARARAAARDSHGRFKQ